MRDSIAIAQKLFDKPILWNCLATLFLVGCEIERSIPTDKPRSPKPAFHQTGEASWYGPGFQGEKTASGETFDQNKLTAAHPTLRLGTKAEVTDVETRKSVEVNINDRGRQLKNSA